MKILTFAATAIAAAAFSSDPRIPSKTCLTRVYSHTLEADDATLLTRRDAVLQSLGSIAVVTAGVTGNPTQAVAGVGAPVPYIEATKTYFTGALANSVAALRVESSLRWKNISDKRRVKNFDDNKKAKYGPKNTLVASCSCSEDSTVLVDTLAGILGKDLTNVGVDGVVSLDCGSSGVPNTNILSDLAASAKTVGSKSDVNIVLVYGPHVGIAKDGRIGYVERRSREAGETLAVSEYVKAAKDSSSRTEESKAISNAAKQAYKKIRDKVESQITAGTGKGAAFWDGIAELTVIGGVTINRSKFGQDGGEDFFYALSAKTYTASGESFDFYQDAFGDRGIAVKDRE